MVSEAYETERQELMQRRTAVAAAMATVLVPLFGAVDYFMYPRHFAVLMAGRVVSAMMSALILALVRGPEGARRSWWLAFVLTLQCGFAIAVIPIYLTGTRTPHYVSAALLILGTTALLPWTVSQIVALTATLTSMFIVAGFLNGRLPTLVNFITQVSAIVVTGVIGVFVSALSESVRAREFATRSDLHAASQEKTRLIHHLEAMALRVATANDDLQERQRETDDFLYVLSHDLRAPLINIQGFGKRLQTDMGSLEGRIADDAEATGRLGRMRQSLEFINAGTAKIDQLISRLLDIARLTTRPSQHEWIEATALVHAVIDACRFQLDAAGIEVSVGDLPRIWGDPVQLNQVFANLIDNAAKYMGHSPRRRVAISCIADGDRYRFAVRDSGPGIEAKDREKVFRLFARLAPNGTAGEGVGLATVRAIVNRHGGRIWVDSTPGDGSTFYFTLPQDPPRSRDDRPGIPSAEGTPAPTRQEAVTHA
jgi:signal transduction histidine kinase